VSPDPSAQRKFFARRQSRKDAFGGVLVRLVALVACYSGGNRRGNRDAIDEILTREAGVVV